MTDLIERLRSRRMLASAGPITGEGRTHAQPMWLTHEPDTDCAEAADKIERLQAAFDAACAFIDSHAADPDITPKMRETYARFIELREALRQGETHD